MARVKGPCHKISLTLPPNITAWYIITINNIMNRVDGLSFRSNPDLLQRHYSLYFYTVVYTWPVGVYMFFYSSILVRCILCYFCICLLLHFHIWCVFKNLCEQCNFFFWRSKSFLMSYVFKGKVHLW